MFYLYSGTTSSIMVPAPSGGSPPRRQRHGLRKKVKKSVLWDVVNPASNPWVLWLLRWDVDSLWMF
jgi:hypothetical protein